MTDLGPMTDQGPRDGDLLVTLEPHALVDLLVAAAERAEAAAERVEAAERFCELQLEAGGHAGAGVASARASLDDALRAFDQLRAPFATPGTLLAHSRRSS